MVIITWYTIPMKWVCFFTLTKITWMLTWEPTLWASAPKMKISTSMLSEGCLPELQPTTHGQNPLLLLLLETLKAFSVQGLCPFSSLQITHLRAVPDHCVAPRSVLSQFPSLQSSPLWPILLYLWQPMLWLLPNRKYNVNTLICASWTQHNWFKNFGPSMRQTSQFPKRDPSLTHTTNVVGPKPTFIPIIA